jgi:hypothetical protein
MIVVLHTTVLKVYRGEPSVNVKSAFVVFKLVSMHVSISEYTISVTLVHLHPPSKYLCAHVIGLNVR